MKSRKGLTGIVLGTALATAAPVIAAPPVDCPLPTDRQGESFPHFFGRRRVSSPGTHDGGGSRPPRDGSRRDGSSGPTRPTTQQPGRKVKCPDYPLGLETYDLGETVPGGYSLETPTDDVKTEISLISRLEPIEGSADQRWVYYDRHGGFIGLELAEPDHHRMRLRTNPTLKPGPYLVGVYGRDTNGCDTYQRFALTLTPAKGSAEPPVDGKKPEEGGKPGDGEKKKCPEGIQTVPSYFFTEFDPAQGQRCVPPFEVVPPLEQRVDGFSLQQLPSGADPLNGYQSVSPERTLILVPRGVENTLQTHRVITFCPDAPGTYRLVVSGLDKDGCSTQLVRQYDIRQPAPQRHSPRQDRFAGHFGVVGGGGQSTINQGDLSLGFGGFEGSAGAQLGSFFLGLDGGYLGKGFTGDAHDGQTPLDVADHIGRLALRLHFDGRASGGFVGMFDARLGWLREDRTIDVSGASFTQTTDAFEGNAVAEFRRLGGSPVGFGLQGSLLAAWNEQASKTFDYQDFAGRGYLSLDFTPVRVDVGADITGLYRVEINENLLAIGPFARLRFPGVQDLTLEGFARFDERREYGGNVGVNLGTPLVRASADCRYTSESFLGQDRSGFNCLGGITFGDQRPLTVHRINPL